MIAKTLLLQEGFPPWPGGSAPGLHWGLRPQSHVIGSRYCARHVPLDPPVDVTDQLHNVAVFIAWSGMVWAGMV